MSFDIGSIQRALGTTPPARGPETPRRAGATFAGVLSNAVKIDVAHPSEVPSSPPPEVIDAMGVAASAHHRLAAANQALSFKIEESTGKVVVSVHDSHGNVLFTIPGSTALDVAAGRSLGG